jgi:hypothetical protein
MDTKAFVWVPPLKSRGLRHSEGADDAVLIVAPMQTDSRERSSNGSVRLVPFGPAKSYDRTRDVIEAKTETPR